MDETNGREDRRLPEGIAAGDTGALEEVYDAYSGAVYRQALAILGSVADAEDVLQDVFLQLVRRRGGPIRDLKAYLLTAARNHACSALRRRRRCTPGDDEGIPWPSAPPPEAPGERVVVREALESLPVAQRQVVILKIYEELTFEEIGRRVQASVSTVASRYRYALKKLRQALGDATDAP